MVPPGSHRVLRARRYSGTQGRSKAHDPTRLSRSTAACSKRLLVRRASVRNDRQVVVVCPPTPSPQELPPWHGGGLGKIPVRSPLLREYCLFHGLREMFQFARFPPVRKRTGTYPEGTWVAPLGDRGIKACRQLPHAFRRGATSVFGSRRRGIHRVLILSCRSYGLRSSAHHSRLMSDYLYQL